jgi:hypothetical protein
MSLKKVPSSVEELQNGRPSALMSVEVKVQMKSIYGTNIKSILIKLHPEHALVTERAVL